MDTDTILRIGREALFLALLISAPPVLAALVVGMIVAVFQAATQLQEQTLSFAPKLIAVAVTLAITGLWLLGQLSQYTANLFELIGRIR